MYRSERDFHKKYDKQAATRFLTRNAQSTVGPV